MVRSVMHEPFYETGMWTDEPLGVYVGWSAHPQSFSSGMPLENERGDVTLVFSGQEYSDPGDITRLKQSGHTFGDGDSSYLVHRYEDEPSFPSSLNGLFHGLVADRRNNTATLFNDRYGMHRVYYHQSDDALYFAGEAKAILAVRPELRDADTRALGEFLACGCVLEDRTLFKGIQLLPGGTCWRFRNHVSENRRRYFQPQEWEKQPALDSEAYYEEVRRAVSDTLPRYFNGHQPTGLALTGGLDTRLIVAWHKPTPRSLSCYTFGSMFRDTQDVVVARQIAARCDQPHTVIRADNAFLTNFAQYAERSIYLTDACIDVSRCTDLYFSERARQLAPVKVVGTYGSEMLTLVPAFKPITPAEDLFTPGMLDSVKNAQATYAALRVDQPVTFAAFRQSPWWHYGVLMLEQTQVTVRSPYLDNNFIKTVYRAPADSSRDVRQRLIRDGDAALAAIPTDRGLGGSKISQVLQNLTLRGEYAYDYAMPQWLARVDRRLAPLHVERLFLGRHKPSHFRLWYRGALSAYVREMLLDRPTRERPYLNRKALESVVNSHIMGTANHTRDIHKLLTLELTHRQFFDRRD